MDTVVEQVTGMDDETLEEFIRRDALLARQAKTRSVGPKRAKRAEAYRPVVAAEEAHARWVAEKEREARKEEKRQELLRSLRAPVFQRDGGRCWLCGAMTVRPTGVQITGLELVRRYPLAPTLDHVIPVSKNGKDEIQNLRCAHSYCNQLRGAKTPREAWELLKDFARDLDPTLSDYYAAGARFYHRK